MTALRIIQGQQQTLIVTMASQRMEDRKEADEDRRLDRKEAHEDRQALIALQAQANRWKGIFLTIMLLTTFVAPLISMALRYFLFGHPPSEGPSGLIK